MGDCMLRSMVTDCLAMLGGKVAVALEFRDEIMPI